MKNSVSALCGKDSWLQDVIVIASLPPLKGMPAWVVFLIMELVEIISKLFEMVFGDRRVDEGQS